MSVTCTSLTTVGSELVGELRRAVPSLPSGPVYFRSTTDPGDVPGYTTSGPPTHGRGPTRWRHPCVLTFVRTVCDTSLVLPYLSSYKT